MTNDETIKNIKELLKWYLKEEPMSETVYKREAVEMAIKAVKQQPCEDAISRQAVLDYAKDTCLDLDKYEDTEAFCDEIKAMPSITPKGVTVTDFADRCRECGRIKLSEDAVSREAVLSLQTEYAEKMGATTFWKLRDDIRGLPAVKPKYTDEEIDKAQAVEQAYVDKMVELAVKETKRPKGKWIAVRSYEAFGGDYEAWMAHGNPIAYHYCSECKEEAYLDEDGEEILSDFCPFCGADMSGGGEDGK